MTDRPAPQPARPRPERPNERTVRLAEALRANLARRKAQTRRRAEADASAPAAPSDERG